MFCGHSSFFVAFLAFKSNVFTCSHKTHPVVVVLESSFTYVGKFFVLLVIGQTMKRPMILL